MPAKEAKTLENSLSSTEVCIPPYKKVCRPDPQMRGSKFVCSEVNTNGVGPPVYSIYQRRLGWFMDEPSLGTGCPRGSSNFEGIFTCHSAEYANLKAKDITKSYQAYGSEVI